MGENQRKSPFVKRPPSFAFVPLEDAHRRSPMRPLPWWAACVGWLRYHGIQLRWDIERGLARLFRRRWGG